MQSNFNDSDRKKISASLTALAEAFRQKTSAAMLLGYEIGLGGLSVQQIEAACFQALRRSRFMPTVSELREFSGVQDSGESLDHRALMAWSTFEGAVIAQGHYHSVWFDDPAIAATIRNLGGWERCCLLPTEEFDKWLRKDFLETYKHFARAGVSEEAGAPLVGWFAHTNSLVSPASDAQGKIMDDSSAPRHVECDYLPAEKRIAYKSGSRQEPPPDLITNIGRIEVK